MNSDIHLPQSLLTCRSFFRWRRSALVSMVVQERYHYHRIYNVLFAEIRDRLSVSVKNLRMGVKITQVVCYLVSKRGWRDTVGHRVMTANYFDKIKKKFKSESSSWDCRKSSSDLSLSNLCNAVYMYYCTNWVLIYCTIAHIVNKDKEILYCLSLLRKVPTR